MIKRIIGSMLLLFSIGTFAQQSTSSIYSHYGIGDIKFKGTVENRSMGGLSILGDSIHINLQNPASYAQIKRTTFTLGGSYNNTNISNNYSTEKARRTAVDYMSMAFPITSKIGVGFGLLPYSAVGYQLREINSEAGKMSNISTGEGGLNKAYASIGYQVNPNLSLGATFNYNFGNIETITSKLITDTQYGTRELSHTEMNGVNFNFGAMWNKKVTEKHTVFAAANYSPGAKINLKNNRNLAVYEALSSGNQNIIDQQDLDTGSRSIKSPTTYSIGAGYGIVRKWVIGAEYTQIDNNGFGNRFEDIKNATFTNGSRLSIGGYYIPKYNSFTSYLSKITYRAGIRLENSGMIVENTTLGRAKEIKDTGVTLGLTLPISGTFSKLNFGIEHGKRGTKDADLIQEKYTNFTFGISFTDLWFVKRKYN